jgi:hypothetical protein
MVAFSSLCMPIPSRAQPTGCVMQSVDAPRRYILHCRDGLRLEAEPGTDYTLGDRDRNGRVDTINLQNGALFLETGAQSQGAGFQVRTPLAIAAVRGTQWALDVTQGGTAVFVLSGRVAVQRSNARAGVELGPGEGVDVDDSGRGALTVRRWPTQRANTLLARFGRQIRR